MLDSPGKRRHYAPSMASSNIAGSVIAQRKTSPSIPRPESPRPQGWPDPREGAARARDIEDRMGGPTVRPAWEAIMTDTVYKVVEVVGTSETSISKAIDAAVGKASETLRHLGWFEVVQIRGSIEQGKVKRYQATLKVGFSLE
jgi:flavin-binding protein dodecin